MSDSWFNIRVLWWHFQIKKGRLFRLRVTFSIWHWRQPWHNIHRPISVYTFQPLVGWELRNDRSWDTYTWGQAP